jgi:hypothetical protein
MTFEEYISLTKLVKLEIDIRPNSTITINNAFKIVKNRINRISNKYNIDCKALLTDNRDNKQYTIYSDLMVSKYNMDKDIIELNIRKITTVTTLDIDTIQHTREIEINKYDISIDNTIEDIKVNSVKNTL